MTRVRDIWGGALNDHNTRASRHIVVLENKSTKEVLICEQTEPETVVYNRLKGLDIVDYRMPVPYSMKQWISICKDQGFEEE